MYRIPRSSTGAIAGSVSPPFFGTAWIRDFLGEMAPFLASGVYTNYLAGDEGDARVRAGYGRSWERLVALKRTFDPKNFFRLNQNVNPAV